jgi:hypothetical protein
MAKPITLRSRGDTFLLLILPLAFIAILAALLTGCGGKRETAQLPVIAANMQEDSASAISEVLAAPVPEGVEPALWAMLRDELALQLETKGVRSVEEMTMAWNPLPNGAEWNNEFLYVDGSDNGIVDLADITPIAINYGSTEVRYCDYNFDGIVDVKDVTRIAQNYGLSCSGFIVDFSSTSADAGFGGATNFSYSDYFKKTDQHRSYRTTFYPWNEPSLWVRIRTLDKDGIEIGSNVFNVGVGGTSPPNRSRDISLLSGVPPAVIWDTGGLFADGNQDGAVDWFDLGYITEYFLGNVTEHPEYAVFDYDGNGVINIGDMNPVVMTYYRAIAKFEIQLSTTSADEGFVLKGEVNYTDSTGLNSGGFRYYEYEIVSPPVGVTYWVRVVPIGRDEQYGLPSTAVEIVP